MAKSQKKINMDVKWKEGARVKASAADAYRFFEKVRQENKGELDIDYAVEASRDETSPFHSELEWSDKIAGHEYRKNQMRYFVRSIEVVKEEIKTPIRVYESIKVERVVEDDDTNKNKYRHVFKSTDDILKDEAGRAQLLSQAIRDALAFKRRYAALSELANIITAIDKEIPKIGEKIAM